MIAERLFKFERHGVFLDYILRFKYEVVYNEDDFKNPLTRYIREIYEVDDLEDEMVGKISSSQAGKVILQQKLIDTELIQMAKDCNYRGHGSKQHDVLQIYLLENDPWSICSELPVWNDIFSGHIDIVRLLLDPVTDFKIQIVDFKPNIIREKKGKVLYQLWLYRKMLSERLNIPRRYIECIYFDDQYAYQLDTNL